MEQKSAGLKLTGLNKASLRGEITIPPSKSHTLRAILFASLGKGSSQIYNYLPSPDTQAMVNACRLLGAVIDVFDDKMVIQGTNGTIQPIKDQIDVGNSGIVLRFCSAVAALSSHPVVITGDLSICSQRPMGPLLQGLCQLGASAVSLQENGYAPVTIQGPLKGGIARITGEDSQPVSALLIAASFIEGETDLFVGNPGEKPWVALTLNWLDRLGIRYENHHFTHYRLFGRASYAGFTYTVPGDLSSAAFPLAAALVTESELLIKNIDLTDCQGDKEAITLFQRMGAHFDINAANRTLLVRKGGQLSGIQADINGCIDGITILAAIACYAKGETHLYNAAIAKQKECNRISCIAKELQKMGAQIIETEDGLKIQGSPLKGAAVHSYHDHRMAMSLSVAALGAMGETSVSSIACIAKTYPTFIKDFNQLGAGIRVLT